MSEDIKNTGPIGVSGGVHVQTAADAAREAGSAVQELNPTDKVADLRRHIQTVIDTSPLSDHHRMMALVKKDELIFWINAGLARNT